MADFTLSSGSICRPHRSPWGGFPTRTMQVSTSAANIPMGRRVTLDYTGSTNVRRVKPSTVAIGAADFYLVGIAAQAATLSASTCGGDISVFEANPQVEFKAVTKGAVLASSNVGQRKKIAYDSTLGIEYIDLTGSTATDWRVVVTDLIDAEGDSGGYVAFRFLSGLEGNVASSVALTSTSPVLAFFG